tara:strand:+ start:668 stop:1579 length:912 start_codon:yes stop_codon:yes gene_type:complete
MENPKNIVEQENQEAMFFIKNCGYQKFDTRLVIPPSQKTIPKWACSNNNYLQTIIISEGVEKIEDGAFEYCRCLSSVVLPKSIKHLGRGIFNGCDALHSVSFHLESLKTVYNDTFGNHVDYYTIGVKKLYIGTIHSIKKIQEFPQLYGYPRQGILKVPVGFDSEGNEVSIRYRLKFPSGIPIYKPGKNAYYAYPERYDKSEPEVMNIIVEEASASIPLILGTLDGETYPITNWENCLYNNKLLYHIAKEQHPILNEPDKTWSFVLNDKPVKTFNLKSYLMDVYQGKIEFSEPIFIVWDSPDDK